MKSGIVAAESIFANIAEGPLAQIDGLGEEYTREEATGYQSGMEGSWVYEELHTVRNIHPSFKYGLWLGMAYSGLESFILRGKAPWTFHNDKPDSMKTKKASECKKIDYPKPDGIFSFDILTNLTRSNVDHEGDQPAHLKIKDGFDPVDTSYHEYGAPETRFCPAKVSTSNIRPEPCEPNTNPDPDGRSMSTRA